MIAMVVKVVLSVLIMVVMTVPVKMMIATISTMIKMMITYLLIKLQPHLFLLGQQRGLKFMVSLGQSFFHLFVLECNHFLKLLVLVFLHQSHYLGLVSLQFIDQHSPLFKRDIAFLQLHLNSYRNKKCEAKDIILRLGLAGLCS